MSNVNEDIGNDLIQAAKKGDINEVRCLISEGANVNAKDNDGWTPLHWAVKNNHSTTAEVLLDNGAGLITFESFQEHYVWRKYQEIETEHCKNSLHLAARLGNLEAVEDLLGKGADVNAQNDIGKTPLHFAAENGYKEVVEALLDKDGIDVNAKDNDGKTPLHLAAQDNNKEIVDVLIKAKANVNIKDEDGKTPFDLTTNEEIKTLLKKAAEKTDPVDESSTDSEGGQEEEKQVAEAKPGPDVIKKENSEEESQRKQDISGEKGTDEKTGSAQPVAPTESNAPIQSGDVQGTAAPTQNNGSTTSAEEEQPVLFLVVCLVYL